MAVHGALSGVPAFACFLMAVGHRVSHTAPGASPDPEKHEQKKQQAKTRRIEQAIEQTDQWKATDRRQDSRREQILVPGFSRQT